MIDNALKIIPTKRKAVISISTKTINGYEQIAIKDNGIDLDKAYQEKVFTLFKRLHTKQEYVGTGISLSICK